MARAALRIGVEIIDIQNLSAIEHFHKPIPGYGLNHTLFDHGREAIAVRRHHPPDTWQVGVHWHGWAKLQHHVARLNDLFVGHCFDD